MVEHAKKFKTLVCSCLVMGFVFVAVSACQPTIKLEGGDKPMEFNINIKHEILIKVEKDVEAIFSDEDLF